MVAAAQPPTSWRRYASPSKVHWPAQFVGVDGLLLGAGAFDVDEVPFGGGECILCEGGDISSGWSQGTAGQMIPPHICEQGHIEARQRICDNYLCYWQELKAPDQRPYYYDHVSHTWTFAKPRRIAIPAGSSETVSAKDEKLKGRLFQGLECTITSAVAAAPVPSASPVTQLASSSGLLWTVEPTGASLTYRCEFCGKPFNDVWAVQAHVYSMSGRKYHPQMPGTQPAILSATSSVAGSGSVLNADLDVQKAESDGHSYWYNPRTRACTWSREELVAQNRDFYNKVTWVQVAPGHNGPRNEEISFVWCDKWHQISAWTLEGLYVKVQQETGGGAGGSGISIGG